jgi:hypothetical protein
MIKNTCTIQITIAFLQSYHSKFIIIQSLNTLVLHFEDVFAHPNLLTSHILCLNETKMKTLDINSKKCFIKKFQIYLAMMNMAL